MAARSDVPRTPPIDRSHRAPGDRDAPSADSERRFDLRASWGGLTPRGGSFLSAGAVALACALLLRQIDLVRIAALLLALPLVLVVYMALVSLHVTVRREASPRRATAGAPVTVTVHLDNRGTSKTPTLLMEDTIPESLAVSARVVTPPLPAGSTARVSYTVVPPYRGRYVLGPARVHATEPFGMVERTWRASGSDDLIVRPPIISLDPPLRPTARSGDSDTANSGISAAGEVDITVREHRDGDDLRRVHWPSTARRGQLMVRRDERPNDLRVVVVLDTRQVGHAGRGRGASLEWAVTAAAAVAALGAHTRHGVTLITDEVVDAAGDIDEALDRLALIEPGPDASLLGGLSRVDSAQGTSVVALLGDVGPDEVAALCASSRDATRIALCLRTTTFASTTSPGSAAAGGSPNGARPTSHSARADQRHRDTVAGLVAAGWSAVSVSAGDDLRLAWAAVAPLGHL